MEISALTKNILETSERAAGGQHNCYTKVNLLSNRQVVKKSSLIDSGSRKNLINYQTYLKFNGRNAPKLFEKTDNDELHSASGGVLKSLGYTKIETKIGTKTFYLEYEVLSNLCVGIILGEEALTQMGVKVDFSISPPIMLFKDGEQVNLASYSKSEGSIAMVLSGKLFVPAKSFQIADTKTDKNIFDGDFFFETKNEKSMDGLVNISRQKSRVPVFNDTDKPIILKAGEIVGHIHYLGEDNVTWYMSRDSVYNILSDPLSKEHTNPVVTRQNLNTPPTKIKHKKKKLGGTPRPTKFPDPIDNFKDLTDEQIIDKKLDLSKSNLSEDEKIKLKNIIIKHKRAFNLRNEIGLINNFTYDIKIKENADHVYRQPFQISPEQEKIMREMIKRLLKLGIISENKELYVPFLSPALLVAKKSGQGRLAVDYRQLNLQLLHCPSSFPTINGLFKKIGKILEGSDNGFLSSFDAVDSFFQVKLSDASKKLTSFTPYEGAIFYFERLPQGISTASSVLSFVMRDILKDLSPNVSSYVDDVILVDSNKNAHFITIEKVLEAFVKRGLQVKLETASFFCKEITFLGRKLYSNGKFGPLEKNITAIKNIKKPTNTSECKSIIGLLVWCQSFISHGSLRMGPINDCLKKQNFVDGKFTWTTAADKALENIKQQITSDPILTLPGDGKYHLFFDASSKGFGSILLNYHKNRWGIVGYSSRPTTLLESKLTSSSSLESLALDHALTHFRSILYGKKFYAYTDNSSLCDILKSTSYPPNKKVLNALTRIMEYPMTLTHVPAFQNGAADALSRLMRRTLEKITNGEPDGERFHLRVDRIIKDVHGDESLAPKNSLINFVGKIEHKKVKFVKNFVSYDPKMDNDKNNPLKSILKTKYDNKTTCPLFGNKTPEKHTKPADQTQKKSASTPQKSQMLRPLPTIKQHKTVTDLSVAGKRITRSTSSMDQDQQTPTPSTSKIDKPPTPNPAPAPSEKEPQATPPPAPKSNETPPIPPITVPEAKSNNDSTPQETAETEQNFNTDEHGQRRSMRARKEPDRLQVGIEEPRKKKGSMRAAFKVFMPTMQNSQNTKNYHREKVSEWQIQPTSTPRQPDAPRLPDIQKQPETPQPQHPPDNQPPQHQPHQDQIRPPNHDQPDITKNLTHRYFPENEDLFGENRPNLKFSDRFHGSIPQSVRTRIRELAKRKYKLSLNREDLRYSQMHDPRYRGIYMFLSDNYLPSDKIQSEKILHLSEQYLLCGGLLFFCPKLLKKHNMDPTGLRLKLVIPDDYIDFFIEYAHSKMAMVGHAGFIKSYYFLKSKYYIFSLADKLRNFIKSCLTCLQTKGIRINPRLGLPLNPTCTQATRPWTHIQLDHLDPFLGREKSNTIDPNTQIPYKRVLLIVDEFSKMVILRPCIGETAAETAKHLNDLFDDKGVIYNMVTDKAAGFTSQVLQILKNDFKFEHHIASSQSHHTVGTGETFVKEAKTILKSIILDNPELEIFPLLPKIQFRMNTAPRQSFKEMTPFKIVHGYDPIDPLEAQLGIENMGLNDNFPVEKSDISQFHSERHSYVNNLLKKHINRYKYEHDSRLKSTVNFKIGDLCLVHATGKNAEDSNVSKKLKRKFRGPFKIVFLTDYHCVLADIKTLDIVGDMIPLRSLVKIDPQVGISDNFNKGPEINVTLNTTGKIRYHKNKYQTLYSVNGKKSDTIWI